MMHFRVYIPIPRLSPKIKCIWRRYHAWNQLGTRTSGVLSELVKGGETQVWRCSTCGHYQERFMLLYFLRDRLMPVSFNGVAGENKVEEETT